jgi:hypothetical protein
LINSKSLNKGKKRHYLVERNKAKRITVAIDLNHEVELLENMLAKLKSYLPNKESENEEGYQKRHSSKRRDFQKIANGQSLDSESEDTHVVIGRITKPKDKVNKSHFMG